MKLMLLKCAVAAVAIATIAGCSKGGDSNGGNSSTPDIHRDLEGFYAFDSNLLTDSSSNAAGGAINHGVTLTADRHGNANRAALFADSAYIEVPSSGATDFHNDLTISAWVNLADSQSTDLLTAVVSKGDSMNYVWQLGVSQAHASGEYGPGQTWLLKYVNLKQTDPLELHKWYMLTMTVAKSSGTVNLYVDTTQVASFTNNGITADDISFADANPVLIGMERSQHFWFDGSVDDLRMYSRVISADEIKLLYAE